MKEQNYDKMMRILKAINAMSSKTLDETSLKRQRKMMERLGRLAASKTDIDISTFDVDEISCEAVKPNNAHNPDYSVLYAHGGGYICGGLGYARNLASKIAVATGFTTYSFDYRLAPEYPYPAALDDGMAVWDYLTDDMYEPDHILLAGDSAGGNLVLCMAQKLLEQKRKLPGGLLLLSPWTDMTGTSESYEINKDKDPILTREYVMDAAKAYVADAGEMNDCRFSPLYGELKYMPPVFIMVGRNEILLDDSIRLKESLDKAGGNAQLDIEENGWHVYQQMPVPIAEQAMVRLAEYVASEIYVE